MQTVSKVDWRMVYQSKKLNTPWGRATTEKEGERGWENVIAKELREREREHTLTNYPGRMSVGAVCNICGRNMSKSWQHVASNKLLNCVFQAFRKQNKTETKPFVQAFCMCVSVFEWYWELALTESWLWRWRWALDVGGWGLGVGSGRVACGMLASGWLFICHAKV